MRLAALTWVLALSFIAAPVAAQEAQPDAPAPERGEKCRAASPGDESAQQPLDDTLQDCKGVLAPPPTGDGDIAAPPPDGGKMPVIAPPEAPAQQPSN